MQDLEQLAAQVLGPHFVGRRFLRYAELETLGICNNRTTLELWIRAGAFPAGIRIAGSCGRTLVWHVLEVAEVLAARMAARATSTTYHDSECEAPELQSAPAPHDNSTTTDGDLQPTALIAPPASGADPNDSPPYTPSRGARRVPASGLPQLRQEDSALD